MNLLCIGSPYTIYIVNEEIKQSINSEQRNNKNCRVKQLSRCEDIENVADLDFAPPLAVEWPLLSQYFFPEGFEVNVLQLL